MIIEIFENLLSVRSYAKNFTNISLFNPHDMFNPHLHFIADKTENLSKFPKVTELVTLFRLTENVNFPWLSRVGSESFSFESKQSCQVAQTPGDFIPPTVYVSCAPGSRTVCSLYNCTGRLW